MTRLQQTCGEMLHAQNGLQNAGFAQWRMATKPALNTRDNRTSLARQKTFCMAVLTAAGQRLQGMPAANDNTMTVGVA